MPALFSLKPLLLIQEGEKLTPDEKERREIIAAYEQNQKAIQRINHNLEKELKELPANLKLWKTTVVNIPLASLSLYNTLTGTDQAASKKLDIHNAWKDRGGYAGYLREQAQTKIQNLEAQNTDYREKMRNGTYQPPQPR